MEERLAERFAERFAAIASNPWISFINSNYDIWDVIVRVLKPMDFVSLALATSFRIMPSPDDGKKCFRT